VRHLARIDLNLNGTALFGATGAKQSARTSLWEWFESSRTFKRMTRDPRDPHGNDRG
jgi:hypothetical protein